MRRVVAAMPVTVFKVRALFGADFLLMWSAVN